jgi:hypothetical protein
MFIHVFIREIFLEAWSGNKLPEDTRTDAALGHLRKLFLMAR